MEPEIIYEDDSMVVLNKPAGLQVHAARISDKKKNSAGRPEGEPATLVDWLVERYPKIGSVGDDPALRPGIVHRLDKDASGVMVVAKTQEAFEHLKSLFKGRTMKKTYLAVVRGVPREKRGTIDSPIGIVNGTLKRSVRSKKMSKEAVTDYRVLRSSPGGEFSMLEVSPRTGRTHQIRVHLASIGHPILGDRLYGHRERKKSAGGGAKRPVRLMLHALSLELATAGGERMKFEADPPEEFREVIHT